jgi:hypothetical protein
VAAAICNNATSTVSGLVIWHALAYQYCYQYLVPECDHLRHISRSRHIGLCKSQSHGPGVRV